MKTCSGCKVTKPLADFGQHLKNKDGLRSRCRSCEAKPPRTGLCGACGESFLYKQRGKEAHVCARCSQTHHWCHICKTAKPRSDFHVQSSARSGLAYRCKACTAEQGATEAGARAKKAVAVRARYGISLEEYEALLSAPEGTCPCCGRSGRQKMVMDHCHETGRIRGVICSACNSGIGLLGDSIEGLERALAYLRTQT